MNSSTAETSITTWLDALASGSPTPGGGAAAALVGALGAALVSMVARFTIDRPKYAAVQDEVAGLLARGDAVRLTLLALVDADAQAYGAVAQAYRLPRGDDGERTTRDVAIQAALIDATEVPLQIGAAAFEVAQLARMISQIGNRSVLTDAGGAALLAEAALRTALLNVDINLTMLHDVLQVTQFRERADALTQGIHAIITETLEAIAVRHTA